MLSIFDQAVSKMGSGSSKARSEQDDHTKPFRRQIGKRSSINFLQRLDNRPVYTHRPPSSSPTKVASLPQRLSFPLPQPLSSHPPPLSPSSSTTIRPPPVIRTLTAFQDPISSDDESGSEHSGSSGCSARTETPSVPPRVPEKESTTVVPVRGPSHGTSSDSSAEDLEEALPLSGAGSSESDSVPATTPQLSSDGNSLQASALTTESGSHVGPATPVVPPQAVATPLLRAPTPLTQDSPTRYGLEEAMEIARVAVMREVQKKRATTGPELFRQALQVQVSTNFANNPPQPRPKPRVQAAAEHPNRSLRIYRPRSKCNPSDLFQRTLGKQHPLPPPRGKDPSPRLIRLSRRPYPPNLLRDGPSPTSTHPAVANIRYALAPPLLAPQRSCYLHHASWHEASNLWHAIECAICLCAGDCTSDTKVMWICGFCAIRICAECREVFEEKGMKALMKRERSGAGTIEARRGRASGRNSTIG
ncbi:hypothetical protein KVT40_004628 [Elsinoe batatas]|uniref:Uncharacterized protein n=1 Tax=Elsinoe batatas TaxID=2601811 RepID=A0A8K0L470_9PEZI|nr:hypothetical protein KVT40_004628 [Elsinoe batatas]